nr:Gag-Pol polyprotein [Tanacetum cinerariifolium]
MQTQTSNTLHNAIMEAGSKDRPPMLAPVNEIRAEKIARVANPLALVAQQQQVYHPQTHPTYYNQHSSTKTHQAATRNRGKAVVNSPQPIYDQEPSMVDDDDETSKEKEIDKLMALISLDNSPRIHRNVGYESQRSGNVAGARETIEWQRFVTLMKQSQELKNISYHKLYDILKQHQHEVNEIRAEKIARVVNPLVLVAQQQQVYHPQTHPTQYNQNSLTKTQAATRNRGKALVNSP